MTEATLLLRQIHPTFVQNSRVTSQAFRPTPKDENQLSADNGDKISAGDAWMRFSAQPECSSAGVMAVSQGECLACAVHVVVRTEFHTSSIAIWTSRHSGGTKPTRLARSWRRRRRTADGCSKRNNLQGQFAYGESGIKLAGFTEKRGAGWGSCVMDACIYGRDDEPPDGSANTHY